jgi:hypothetical protein
LAGDVRVLSPERVREAGRPVVWRRVRHVPADGVGRVEPGHGDIELRRARVALRVGIPSPRRDGHRHRLSRRGNVSLFLNESRECRPPSVCDGDAPVTPGDAQNSAVSHERVSSPSSCLTQFESSRSGIDTTNATPSLRPVARRAGHRVRVHGGLLSALFLHAGRRGSRWTSPGST